MVEDDYVYVEYFVGEYLFSKTLCNHSKQLATTSVCGRPLSSLLADGAVRSSMCLTPSWKGDRTKQQKQQKEDSWDVA